MSRASASYIIDGGEPGAARLAVLGRTLAASSESFLRRTGLRPGVRVLDVGCGSGELTGWMADLVGPAEVVGIDVDLTVLSIARERWAAHPASPRFVLADAAAVPAALGRFDVVYARFVLSHQTDPIATLRSLRELCRPGGVVAVEDVDIPAMFDEVLEELQRVTDDPDTVIGLPRIHQVMGRTP